MRLGLSDGKQFSLENKKLYEDIKEISWVSVEWVKFVILFIKHKNFIFDVFSDFNTDCCHTEQIFALQVHFFVSLTFLD